MKTEGNFTFMLSNTDRITTNDRGHDVQIGWKMKTLYEVVAMIVIFHV